jgi:hypothetical protein
VTLHPCGGTGSRGGSSGSKYGAIPARCCNGSKVYAFASRSALENAVTKSMGCILGSKML